MSEGGPCIGHLKGISDKSGGKERSMKEVPNGGVREKGATDFYLSNGSLWSALADGVTSVLKDFKDGKSSIRRKCFRGSRGIVR